jgi:hypothetical protein
VTTVSGTDLALRESLARVGIDFDLDDASVSRTRFEDVGRSLGKLIQIGRFAVGEWVRVGAERYGMTIEEASELSDLSPSTLGRLRWVAERIAPEQRRLGLSFTHHQLVAGLPVEQQEAWLKKAEEDGLTSKELDAALHVAVPARPEPPAALAVPRRTGGPSATSGPENGSQRRRPGRPRRDSPEIPEAVDPAAPRIELEEAARAVVQHASTRRAGHRKYALVPDGEGEPFDQLRQAIGQARLPSA